MDRSPGDPDRTSDEPRQRWRLVFRRASDAPRLPQRETLDAFDAALADSGLPLVTSGRWRSRIAFGAPLAAMPAERELADLVLADRLPVAVVRDRLGAVLPVGWQLVEVFDIWLGEPSLVSQIAAADYRVELASPNDGSVDRETVARAASTLLRAASLPREREKGSGTVAYDLRPLLVDVRVDPAPSAGPTERTTVHIRTRFHPELGTGRPEEVLAALGDEIGTPLAAEAIVRERVLLADEIPA